MIELRNLSFRYPNAANDTLSAINLSIERGEQLALVGPSGSGKTTLLHIIAAMLRVSGGTYHLEGNALHLMNEAELDVFRARNVGVVFQQPALLPHLSLVENVLLPVWHRSKERPLFKIRAVELLGQLGIGELMDRLPSAVSGGQAQRASIARALITSPRLVVADEPTSALDSVAADAVVQALKHACVGQTTLVLATHDGRVLGSGVRIMALG